MTTNLTADHSTTPGPVGSGERIDSIDVLRGFALLGILVLNIQAFSMISAMYLNPTATGTLSGMNYVIWLVSHLFFDHKMMPLFAMLFGAGIVLMSSRQEQKGLKPAALHVRRMVVLLVFGLLHAYGLWSGDILYHYALCGLVVFLFRRRSPRLLIALGLLFYCVAPALSVLFELSMPHWSSEQLEETAKFWSPTETQIAEETAAYRGGWLQQCQHRVPSSIFMQTFLFFTDIFWDSTGLMLWGMALYKLGILNAQKSAKFYASLFIAGMLVGIPIVLYGVQRNFAAKWDFHECFFSARRANTFGSLFITFGWIGLIMLICKLDQLPRITGALGAVGRLALTNYLLQTLICTTIFYGHGLGLFGKVERVGQIAVVVSIWAVHLIISPLWIRYFRFGPAEWLWRSLSYLRVQPLQCQEE